MEVCCSSCKECLGTLNSIDDTPERLYDELRMCVTHDKSLPMFYNPNSFNVDIPDDASCVCQAAHRLLEFAPITPEIIDQIRNSLESERGFLRELLEAKKQRAEQQAANPSEVYIRVGLCASILGPMTAVLEIWPKDAKSPKHQHGGCAGSVHVLHGLLGVRLFRSLDHEDPILWRDGDCGMKLPQLPDGQGHELLELTVGTTTWLNRNNFGVHEVRAVNGMVVSIHLYKSCTDHFEFLTNQKLAVKRNPRNDLVYNIDLPQSDLRVHDAPDFSQEVLQIPAVLPVTWGPNSPMKFGNMQMATVKLDEGRAYILPRLPPFATTSKVVVTGQTKLVVSSLGKIMGQAQGSNPSMQILCFDAQRDQVGVFSIPFSSSEQFDVPPGVFFSSEQFDVPPGTVYLEIHCDTQGEDVALLELSISSAEPVAQEPVAKRARGESQRSQESSRLRSFRYDMPEVVEQMKQLAADYGSIPDGSRSDQDRSKIKAAWDMGKAAEKMLRAAIQSPSFQRAATQSLPRLQSQLGEISQVCHQIELVYPAIKKPSLHQPSVNAYFKGDVEAFELIVDQAWELDKNMMEISVDGVYKISGVINVASEYSSTLYRKFQGATDLTRTSPVVQQWETSQQRLTLLRIKVDHMKQFVEAKLAVENAFPR